MLIEIARREYNQGAWEQATGHLSKILQESPRSSSSADAYYLRGLCYRQMGTDNAHRAGQDFHEALKLTRNQHVRLLTHIALGHHHFESPLPASQKAIDHYQKALASLENSPPRDAVLYRLAVSLQQLGQWKSADVHFSECFNQFKASSYAPEARRRFGGRRFQVQIDTFSTLAKSQKLVAQQVQSGQLANWAPVEVDDKMLYAVRLGNFQTYRDATRALNNLSISSPDAIIVVSR